MENLKLEMDVKMNRTIVRKISQGGSATLTATRTIRVPRETVEATLTSGEKVKIDIGGYERPVEVKFHFVRDKSRGGSHHGK